MEQSEIDKPHQQLCSQFQGNDKISFLKRQFCLYWYSLRPRESLMMLGVPLLGILFSYPQLSFINIVHFLIFITGAFFIAGHVYTLNDLCGLTYDIYDTYKLERPIHSKQLQAKEVFFFSLVMMIIGLFLEFYLNLTVFIVALIIIALWAVYAMPSTLFKGIPVLTSIMNSVGSGILPFLLGYALFTPYIDFRGILLSVYFGLIAGAGQLNREIIDIEPDIQAGLTTTAVKFGKKITFTYSFYFFLISTIYFCILTISGLLRPKILLIFPIFGSIIHAIFYLKFQKTNLKRDIIINYVKYYRAIYAFIGIAIIITTFLKK